VLATLHVEFAKAQDTLIGTFTVNYRYNAAGQAVDQSNPDYTKANPCFGNTIPPGPIFVPNTTAPGQYKLVVVSGAGCAVWDGDCSSGTFFVTGHNPGEEVTINHTFGQIVLYYWDWIAGDNDPSIQTTVSVYQVHNLCQPGTVFQNVLLPEVVLDIPILKVIPLKLRFAPLGLNFTVQSPSEAAALCEAQSNVGTLTMGIRRIGAGGQVQDKVIGYSTAQATLTLFNDGRVRWHTPGFDVVPAIPVPGINAFCSVDELTEWLTPGELGFSPLTVPFEQTVRAAEPILHLRLSERMKSLSCVHFLVIEDPGATEFLVSDPGGRQTGMTSTGDIAEEIPGSAYFSTGPLVIVFAPAEGRYETEILGKATGTYTLAVGMVDFLNPTSSQNFSGPIAAGFSEFYSTRVDLQAGEVATELSFGHTIEYFRAYVTGLFEGGKIRNRGVANSLSRKLANAQKHISPMDASAVRSVMNAFLNEVKAQRGKHIDAAVADNLSATAEFLIDSLGP